MRSSIRVTLAPDARYGVAELLRYWADLIDKGVPSVDIESVTFVATVDDDHGQQEDSLDDFRSKMESSDRDYESAFADKT